MTHKTDTVPTTAAQRFVARRERKAARAAARAQAQRQAMQAAIVKGLRPGYQGGLRAVCALLRRRWPHEAQA